MAAVAVRRDLRRVLRAMRAQAGATLASCSIADGMGSGSPNGT